MSAGDFVDRLDDFVAAVERIATALETIAERLAAAQSTTNPKPIHVDTGIA